MVGFNYPGLVSFSDSRRHYRERYTDAGEKREFRGLISIVLTIDDLDHFNSKYDDIIDEFSERFHFSRTRKVYKAFDIGSMFPRNVDRFRTACLNITRKILNLDVVKATYVVTRINPTHLEEGQVIIHGRYGSPTKRISVPEFIDTLQPYHHVISCWAAINELNFEPGTIVLDGIDNIPDCVAWDELSRYQTISIVFNGDKLVRGLSAADIILRSLEFFLQQTSRRLDEDLIRNIVLHRDYITNPNIKFMYLGNPDINNIKPLSTNKYSVNDNLQHIHHPILFISAGGVVGQSDLIERMPRYESILNRANEIGAAIKIYNPHTDRYLIGAAEVPDYFLALNDMAKNQFQAMEAGGTNVSPWDS